MVGRDGDVALVEESVDVRTEEQAVGDPVHSAKVVRADMSGVERGKGMLPSDRTGPAIGIENAGPENSLANSGPDQLGITISRLHAGNFCVNHSGLRNCPAMVPDPLTLTRWPNRIRHLGRSVAPNLRAGESIRSGGRRSARRSSGIRSHIGHRGHGSWISGISRSGGPYPRSWQHRSQDRSRPTPAKQEAPSYG